MSESDKPSWVLALIICWYVTLLLGSGFFAFLGTAFVSEPYRTRDISGLELAVILGPFFVTLALLLATMLLWKRDRIAEALSVFGISFALIAGVLFFGGLLNL